MVNWQLPVQHDSEAHTGSADIPVGDVPWYVRMPVVFSLLPMHSRNQRRCVEANQSGLSVAPLAPRDLVHKVDGRFHRLLLLGPVMKSHETMPDSSVPAGFDFGKDFFVTFFLGKKVRQMLRG